MEDDEELIDETDLNVTSGKKHNLKDEESAYSDDFEWPDSVS